MNLHPAEFACSHHFQTEQEARTIATMMTNDDPDWTYDVVMTPRSTYVIAVIDGDDFLGFL
jgi:hypothetical protein